MCVVFDRHLRDELAGAISLITDAFNLDDVEKIKRFEMKFLNLEHVLVVLMSSLG